MDQIFTDLLDPQSLSFGISSIWAALTIAVVWASWRRFRPTSKARVDSFSTKSKAKKVKSKRNQAARSKHQNTAEASSTKDQNELEELLRSLELPAELTLLSESESAKRITYSTMGETEASRIGTAFADELERIGFEITPIDQTNAEATSEAGTLKLCITPEAGSLTEDGQKRFPYIRDDSVVVEVWLSEDS